MVVSAVIKTGGKQFSVSLGDRFVAERFSSDKASHVFEIKQVLALQTKEKYLMGKPVIEGASVNLKAIREIRHPKVLVFKKKRRNNYRRLKGHRQDGILLQVEDIKLAGSSLV